MKGARQTWPVVERGTDLAKMRKSLQQSVHAFLSKEKAIEAEVVMARVQRTGESTYELTFVVAYWPDVTLQEWVESALSEPEAGLGPGKIQLPEAAP